MPKKPSEPFDAANDPRRWWRVRLYRVIESYAETPEAAEKVALAIAEKYGAYGPYFAEAPEPFNKPDWPEHAKGVIKAKKKPTKKKVVARAPAETPVSVGVLGGMTEV